MSQPIYLVVLRIKIIGLAYTGIFPVNEIVISAWLVTAARLRPVVEKSATSLRLPLQMRTRNFWPICGGGRKCHELKNS